MSHLTQSMVEQFFELEKESARGVLRKEMDSAMDTIFKQMKRKLMMLVESGCGANETGHGLADLGDRVHHEQQFYDNSSFTNPISSTTTNSQARITNLNVSNLSQIGQIKVNSTNDNCDKPTNESIPSNSTQSQLFNVKSNENSSNQLQNDKIVVKEEFDETVNMISNEPSCTRSSNDNNDDLLDELDDDDCDCPQCVGDLFVKMEEGVDYSVQLVEDLDQTDDSNPKPTKRCRLEADQSQPSQAEAYNQYIPNQYITISLKCPECSETYQDKTALNAHLKSVHSILQYRCLFKDCNLSFDKRNDIYEHQRATHPSKPNSIWPCGYCSGHSQSSKSSLTHYLMLHEEGLFRCCHPNCQFVGELRQTVHNHFMFSHKYVTTQSSTNVFVCQFPGCKSQFQKYNNLKSHERSHSDVRPYRCKLPDCTYDSTTKGSVIRHIGSHLKKVRRQNRRFKDMSDDPNDYLEVVYELLWRK